MTDQRWQLLMKDDSVQLTEDEIQQGWHFCYDFDGLLVGPDMEEWKICTCHLNETQQLIRAARKAAAKPD